MADGQQVLTNDQHMLAFLKVRCFIVQPSLCTFSGHKNAIFPIFREPEYDVSLGLLSYRPSRDLLIKIKFYKRFVILRLVTRVQIMPVRALSQLHLYLNYL